MQQDLFRRGGKRKGAGRKPKGARAGSPHKRRPAIRPDQPLHVVLRVVAQVRSTPWLRAMSGAGSTPNHFARLSLVGLQRSQALALMWLSGMASTGGITWAESVAT